MYINIIHLAHRQFRMSGAAVYQLKRIERERPHGKVPRCIRLDVIIPCDIIIELNGG